MRNFKFMYELTNMVFTYKSQFSWSHRFWITKIVNRLLLGTKVFENAI